MSSEIYITTCANCGEVVEVSIGEFGIDSIEQIDPYICDACETRRDEEADDRDHEYQY